MEEITYSDNTLHHLIVLVSPYDNTEIRHCWDSLEVKQLRAVQEGVFLEFCPHCSSSVDLVQLGFTLRLPQKDIENCLEYFCQHTSAKRKQDEKYICEMTTHSILCTHSPPVRPAPNPPPVPTGMHLTLYNVSDVLFRSSTESTRLNTAVTPPRAMPQRAPTHYVNQDTENPPNMTTQKTSTEVPQLSGSHVSNRPPIIPRRKVPGKKICMVCSYGFDITYNAIQSHSIFNLKIQSIKACETRLYE